MVTIERLRELFSYDPETGIVTRKHNGRVCGVRGGQDYIRALVDGELLHVHRIAFALYAGHMPEVVDHADRDKRNNRATNLRDGTQSDNTCNRPSSGGVSRFKGVHFDKQTGKWRAEVKKNGMRKRIGRFDTEEEAARAYDEAAKKIHGSFARLNYE